MAATGSRGNFLPSSSLTPEEQLASGMEFYAYMAELIAAQRAEPGDGLIATMIEARDNDDRLSEDELVRNAVVIFLAGQQATALMLCRGILRLLDPRESYKALVAYPELIPTAVEEILRAEPPSDGALIRVATRDVELPSGTVRKGEGVIASVASANHDPSVYDEPGELRLDRTGPPNLSFGRGAHYCLGAGLGRMELQEALKVLVERLPGLALAVPPDELAWSESAFKYPTGLPVILG